MSFLKSKAPTWGSTDPSSSSSGGASTSKHSARTTLDFTRGLRDRMFYKPGHLRSLGLCGEITALAFDPMLSLLAIGTSTGFIHLVGSPAFQCTLSLNPMHHARRASAGGASSSAPVSSGGVKHLVFHPGATRIVAIDAKNTLHSWHLGPGCMDDKTGLPMKEVTVSLYGDVVFCETPSPAQSHVAILMQDGQTLFYDLARRNLSPYKIPNCWAAYEDKLRRSGVLGRGRKLQTPQGICMARNPRDLNTVLVGYEGGVVAWDVKEGMAVKTFEMVLTPGAPGGATYADNTIWSERMPPVTSIAWRPDGLVFAVGHEDGCIAIWSVDDPDKPLMVRTIEREDVNVTDAESLFDAGALDDQLRRADLKGQPPAVREPIFKLVWVSFPDAQAVQTMMTPAWADQGHEPPSEPTLDYASRGETLLVILGGALTDQPPAINVLQMPSYTAPPPRPNISGQPQEGLTLIQRTAYRDSLNATGVTQYQTETPAEDFTLMPRINPFFDLSHDPIAIIILMTPLRNKLPAVDGPFPQRSVAAWTFPPPRSDVPPAETGRKEIRTAAHEIENIVPMTSAPISPAAGHFASMQRSGSNQSAASSQGSGWRIPWLAAPASPKLLNTAIRTPDAGFRSKQARSTQALRLPSLFWTGETAVLGANIYPLDNEVFKRLISHAIESEGREAKPRLKIRGGVAVPDLKSPNAPDPVAIKLEKYRVMATWSLDGCVRFWDISPQILVLPSPLRFEYPSPLNHLTVSIPNILSHPSMAHTEIAKLYRKTPSLIRITGVRLAGESSELAIVMATGEVLVYKFESGSRRREEPGYFPEQSDDGRGWEEIVHLDHLADTTSDGFKPKCMIDIKRGPVAHIALSNVGFLAISYEERSMAIIDLRGPDVILREGFNAEGRKVKNKKKKSHDLPAESSVCRHLAWSICHVGGQGILAPRLIALYAKGLTKIFTLNHVLGEWLPDNKTITFSHDSLAFPLLSAVLDVESGAEIGTPRHRLQLAMQDTAEPPSKEKRSRCIWIAASRKAVRTHLDFNGERIAKYELGEHEEFVNVQVITKNGLKVVVGVKADGVADVLSVPALELIDSARLDMGMPGRHLGRLAFDVSSGDYVEYISPMEIYLRTLFSWRKPLMPRVDPFSVKHNLPPVPQPANAGWGTWIWGGAPLTGAQIDAILAGPNRPGVPKPSVAHKPAAPLITWGQVPEKAPSAYVRPTVKPAAKRQASGSKNAAAAPASRTDAYEDMTRAARERGNVLDGLEDQMESMASSAFEFVKTARNTAAKESAKLAGKSMFGF